MCESHNKNSDPKKPDTEENILYSSICLKYKKRHDESVLSEARLVVGLGVAVPVRDTGGCWVLTEFCFLIWVLAMQECSMWGHELSVLQGKRQQLQHICLPVPRTDLGTLFVQ